MNRGRNFRRRFDTGIDRLQHTASQVESKVKDQASALAEQAREGYTRSRDTLVSLEHALERNVRANRGFYIAAALALIGLLAAKLILDWREEQRGYLD
ncbi:MAG: hypothetical protein WCP06_08635 [Verrucomicrobiota bacterium]